MAHFFGWPGIYSPDPTLIFMPSDRWFPFKPYFYALDIFSRDYLFFASTLIHFLRQYFSSERSNSGIYKEASLSASLPETCMKNMNLDHFYSLLFFPNWQRKAFFSLLNMADEVLWHKLMWPPFIHVIYGHDVDVTRQDMMDITGQRKIIRPELDFITSRRHLSKKSDNILGEQCSFCTGIIYR